MRRFDPPFETLKRVRRTARDEARQKLLESREQLRRASRSLEQVKRKKEQLDARRQQDLSRGEDPQTLLYHDYYRQTLNHTIKSRRSRVRDCKDQVEIARTELAEKVKRFRLIEKLEEKQNLQRREEVKKMRQKQLDEVARNQDLRKSRFR